MLRPILHLSRVLRQNKPFQEGKLGDSTAKRFRRPLSFGVSARGGDSTAFRSSRSAVPSELACELARFGFHPAPAEPAEREDGENG